MSGNILDFRDGKGMGFPMNARQGLLKRLDKAWCEFRESYAGMTDVELLRPGVTGSWSVRDIIVHVTTWEKEALKYLPLSLQGKRPPRYSVMYGGIDAFNAQTIESKKGLTLPEVLKRQIEVHRQLIHFIESAPEESLSCKTRFVHRLRMDTYGHYSKHALAIRRWRNANDK
jgi:hypothetical protein